jgi:hypothetical protein
MHRGRRRPHLHRLRSRRHHRLRAPTSHQDGVPLVGVDVSDAFLQGVDLNGADLLRELHVRALPGATRSKLGGCVLQK